MGHIESEKLILKKETLVRGIAYAKELKDNAEIPGWIESFQARHSVSPSVVSRISLASPDILTQARVLDEEIPTVLKKASQSLSDKSKEYSEINSLMSATEPEDTKVESFSNSDATMLARFLKTEKANTFIRLNGSSFNFEIDKDVLDACDRLEQLPAEPEPQSVVGKDILNKQKTIRLLKTLRDILEDEDKEKVIGSQSNKDVELVLIWLNLQNNDKFYGILPDFLEATNNLATIQVDRFSYVSGYHKEWIPAPEVLHKAKVAILRARIETQRTIKSMQLPTAEPKTEETTQQETLPTKEEPSVKLSAVEGVLINKLILHWSKTRAQSQSLSQEKVSLGNEIDQALILLHDLPIDQEKRLKVELNRREYLMTRANALGKLRRIVQADPSLDFKHISDQAEPGIKMFLTKILQKDTNHDARLSHFSQMLDDLAAIPNAAAWRREKWIHTQTPSIIDSGTPPVENRPSKDQEVIVPTQAEKSQPKSTLKVLDIEKRDPEIRTAIQRLTQYVQEKKVSWPISIAQVSNVFPALEYALDNKIYRTLGIKPQKVNHSNYLHFTQEDVVLMLYAYRGNGSRGTSIATRLIKEINTIIEQETGRLVKVNTEVKGDQRSRKFELETELRLLQPFKDDFEEARQQGIEGWEDLETTYNQERSRIMTELEQLKSQ
ncbi:MAG: hypothetical protein Q7R49_03790 [Candidatus Daviesbacteria bacterium]|nr:hypothetical protein [Candidatus Daviesbacteria bacterium]